MQREAYKMDIQLKRGLLEVCILKVLSIHDSYGYQIIKDLSKILDISESTLYPILKRLEGADCLTVYSVEHNSRLRKYYKITQQGQERIRSFLDEFIEVITVYQFIKGENIYDKK